MRANRWRWTVGAAALLLGSCIDVPPRAPVAVQHRVAQGWDAAQREWFYHTPQGTQLMARDFFLNLERPELFAKGKLSDPEYLARFGFLVDDSPDNTDRLPVGFAVDDAFDDLTTAKRKKSTVVGFTCAACHTGEIHYKGTSLRIDGGPSMINLQQFRQAIFVSVMMTKWIPGRLSRFASAVRKAGGDAQSEPEIRARFANFRDRLTNAKKEADQFQNVDEGFARLDALTRIGNFVFGTDLGIKQNLRAITAPVNFPHIWSAHWFDWVQYNASIEQPMARNVGEALGVRAQVDLTGTEDRFLSTVRVGELAALEKLIAGDAPFTGLQAPKWPVDVLGPLDPTKLVKGRMLYMELCAECHLAPLGSQEFADRHDDYWTTPPGSDVAYLHLTTKSVADMGTDPAAAHNFASRTAQTGPLGAGEVSAADGLRTITEGVANRWYDDQKISTAKRMDMNGNRENQVRGLEIYKARPLDGIWATAPYLHNGSVPNLDELLGPPEKRSKTFYLGSREFDPERVGFETGKIDGGFLFDTQLTGNHNTGHEFRGDGTLRAPGVLGRALGDDESKALIEFLKSL